MFEGNNIEFKQEYVDDIKKTVIAFANTEGGYIYIGISDNGQTIGIDNPDATMLKCSNAIRDSIHPDVTMFVSYHIENIDDKNIVVIKVQRGTSTPYYLESKGIRPAGVYIRQGASTVPASETAILKMIKETDGDKYENVRSIQQELTFNITKEEFNRANIAFEEQQQRTLKLINNDGVYTNLAFLLSDQCSHTIKAAVFNGTEKINFKDRAEFTGSLLNQVNTAYEYISRYNRTRSEFDGIHRVDIRDYPTEAIREALLNAIIHRDYAFSASILISIFDDRIEFISIGGLVRGISQDEIFMGLSVQRNENLANVFYRLNLVEAFGTGIPRIIKLYEKYAIKPKFEITDNAFKIILPNTSMEQINCDYVLNIDVLSLVIEMKSISRRDVENRFNVSQATAARMIQKLVKNGKLTKIGSGKNSRYIKADK